MFKSKNFCHIASNNRNQVKVGVFVYRTPDDVDTVTQSGYFNERIIDINLHDIIIHEQIDPADNTQVAVNTLCVTGRSLDNVTTDVVSTGGGGSGVSSLNGQTGDLNIKSIDGNSLMGSGNLELSTYVRKDGNSIMTGPLRFDASTQSEGMTIGINPNGSNMEFYYQYPMWEKQVVATVTWNGIIPGGTTQVLGSAAKKWSEIYVTTLKTGVINNGYDIAVPVTNSADTLALKSQVVPQLDTMPTVDATNIDEIVQYKGATDANYTNGYFYKATGNVLSVPGSVTCAEVSAYYKTISMDVDGFINYMMTLGYYKGTIEEWLNNNGEFSYDVDANTLSWSWYGLFPDPSTALQFFTFSPAAASGEYIVWRTSNYVAAHTEVQNAAWTQVQTQPGAVSPTVMPTLLVANWSSSTQMITVQGVTASNNVIVSPAPASAGDWASAGIICTAQSTNSLTFTCTQMPSNDITVNVAIL